MEYTERISPFIKNIHNGEPAGYGSGTWQTAGMPEENGGQKASSISYGQVYRTGMYPYSPHLWPGQYFPSSWYLPYYPDPGLCSMGSWGPADMAPGLFCVMGSAPIKDLMGRRWTRHMVLKRQDICIYGHRTPLLL